MYRRPNHILSDRERRFVDEYLIDLNRTQAAARAGYSPRSSRELGMRLMKRPRVRDAVKRAMARRARRNEVDQDRVVLTLAAVAFGNPRVLFDDTGALLPLHRLPDEAAALIASLDIVANVRDDGGKAEYVAKIRTADRLKSLELLGRHLGLFDGTSEPADGDARPLAFEVTFVGGNPADEVPALPESPPD